MVNSIFSSLGSSKPAGDNIPVTHYFFFFFFFDTNQECFANCQVKVCFVFWYINLTFNTAGANHRLKGRQNMMLVM